MTFRNLLIFSILAFTVSSATGADLSVVERWLQTNQGTKSLKVDFVQSRSLKALKSPIDQTGTLWLDYQTNQFRWQLGDPAKTIVVSQGKKIVVMRTPLKRVEYRDAGQSSGSSSGLSGLTKGFPRTMTEFQQRYRVLKIVEKGNAWEIATRPLGPDGEGVSQFNFIIDRERYLLKGLIIDLKDGSSITTTFRRINRNPKIAAEIFRPDLTGYRETKFKQG